MAYVSSPGSATSQMTSYRRHVVGEPFDPSEHWYNHFRSSLSSSCSSSPSSSPSSPSASSPSPSSPPSRRGQRTYTCRRPLGGISAPPPPSPPSPSSPSSPNATAKIVSEYFPTRKSDCAVVVDMTWGSRSRSAVSVRIGSVHPPPSVLLQPKERSTAGKDNSRYPSNHWSGGGASFSRRHFGARRGPPRADVGIPTLPPLCLHRGAYAQEAGVFHIGRSFSSTRRFGSGCGSGCGSGRLAEIDRTPRVGSDRQPRSAKIGIGTVAETTTRAGGSARGGGLARNRMGESSRVSATDVAEAEGGDERERERAEEEKREKEGEDELEEEKEESIYQPFIDYAVAALGKKMQLWSYPVKEKHKRFSAVDEHGQRAVCTSISFQTEKLRHIRTCHVRVGSQLEVLNLIVSPRAEYDLPVFAADMVTLPRGHIIIIDANPIFPTEEYFEKHIRKYMPLVEQFEKDLPWGGALTGESMQFFSPALLWTRPPGKEVVKTVVFEAFKAYFDLYLESVVSAEVTTDPHQIALNQEEQHKYICWRATKDPGRPLLTKLFGKDVCEDYIHTFLFDGLDWLGEKQFLDYFPQYETTDGAVSKRRSMAGKMYSTRPWNSHGQWIA